MYSIEGERRIMFFNHLTVKRQNSNSNSKCKVETKPDDQLNFEFIDYFKNLVQLF